MDWGALVDNFRPLICLFPTTDSQVIKVEKIGSYTRRAESVI